MPRLVQLVEQKKNPIQSVPICTNWQKLRLTDLLCTCAHVSVRFVWVCVWHQHFRGAKTSSHWAPSSQSVIGRLATREIGSISSSYAAGSFFFCCSQEMKLKNSTRNIRLFFLRLDEKVGGRRKSVFEARTERLRPSFRDWNGQMDRMIEDKYEQKRFR